MRHRSNQYKIKRAFRRLKTLVRYEKFLENQFSKDLQTLAPNNIPVYDVRGLMRRRMSIVNFLQQNGIKQLPY